MRRNQRNNTSQACTNCQKRKSRCIVSNGPEQPCTYCQRTNKACIFQKPPARTSLTRDNLDAAEKRCADLENLLVSLCPGIDVTKALQDVKSSRNTHSDSQSPECLERLHIGGEMGPWSIRGKEAGSGNVHSSPNEPHLDGPFEWQHRRKKPYPMIEDEHATESTEVDGDGMANLYSIDSGYLGSSAGSDLLLEIASLLPDTSTILATTPGVGNSQPSQYFDPPQLFSSAVAARLIDAYFLFYNSCYPIFHEKTFRNQVSAYWSESRPKTSRRDIWPVLYYMVLAVGYWASTPYKPKMYSSYFQEARARLTMNMLEAGNIQSLQAALLIGNYLQKCGDRLNAGYIFIGMAIHMTLAMGLHREVTYILDDIQSERRRRLFGVVYVFDSGFSVTTGRPLTMSLEGYVDCKPSSNIDDKEIDYALDLSRDQVLYPTCCSAIIIHVELAKYSNEIYRKFLLARTHRAQIDYQVSEMLDDKIVNWYNNLPDYFTSSSIPEWFHHPREIIKWKYYNMRTLLWRGTQSWHPFLPDAKPAAHERFFDISLESLNTLSDFCRESGDSINMAINWYTTYHVFQATLAMEAGYFTARAEVKSDSSFVVKQQTKNRTILWTRAFRQAKESLTYLAKNNASAVRCLDVVDKIHQQIEADNHKPEMASAASGPEFTTTDLQDVGLADATEGAPHGDLGFDFSGLGHIGMGMNDFQSDQTLRFLVDQMPLGTNMEVSWEALFSTDPNMGMPMHGT